MLQSERSRGALFQLKKWNKTTKLIRILVSIACSDLAWWQLTDGTPIVYIFLYRVMIAYSPFVLISILKIKFMSKYINGVSFVFKLMFLHTGPNFEEEIATAPSLPRNHFTITRTPVGHQVKPDRQGNRREIIGTLKFRIIGRCVLQMFFLFALRNGLNSANLTNELKPSAYTLDSDGVSSSLSVLLEHTMVE